MMCGGDACVAQAPRPPALHKQLKMALNDSAQPCVGAGSSALQAHRLIMADQSAVRLRGMIDLAW
jgi:hypothetical protein